MNVIKIDKHVPMPAQRGNGSSKYDFLKELEIGDSFVIDDNTPDFDPKEGLSSCYSYIYKLRQQGGEFRGIRISARTIRGNTKRPRAVRIRRVA